jgi:hypothetical protein
LDAVERFAAELLDLPAADERFDPALDDLARDAVDFVPLLRDDAERELFAALPLDRLAVERDPDDLRVPVDRLELPLPRADEVPDEPPLLLLADPSIDHLPDITRCAASATASAMSEPNRVALDAMLLAA